MFRSVINLKRTKEEKEKKILGECTRTTTVDEEPRPGV
jgi:hypothetical protein